MFRSAINNTLSLLFLCLLGLVFSYSAVAQDSPRFTKYNIHTQSKDGTNFKASYANYTDPGAGHVIVPVGTKIQIVKQGWRGFVFTYDNGSKKVTFEYQKKRMGMSMDEYIEKITSSQPVSYKKLSKQDKKGIADGRAYKGMTRKGVMAALGYPAAHRTPSLESNTWIYWANRFRTVGVDFDAQGKVANVR
ncbi:MAG: hypothetical protein U9R69_09500 [Thermodesulfobacteriota bacterium]|nr:hypothetical protein [Thermodesulfobacteriota bacterium]